MEELTAETMLGQRIVGLIDRFSVGLVYGATACVAFMMVIGVVDTLSSKLINRPLPGYFEFTEVSMVLMIVLPLAYVQRQRRHITMTAITGILPPKVQRLLEALALLIALFAVLMVIWAGSKAAWNSVQVREYFPALLQYPVYPWKLAFVLGFATLAIKLVADLVKSLAELLEAPQARDIFRIEHVTDETTGLAGFGALFVLVTLGVPVGFSLLTVGIVGLTLVGNWGTALAFLTSVPYNTTATYGFAVVPMFLLMANLIGGAGFARDTYSSAAKWVGRLPAGLAIATMGGAALFGAVCGSSLASAALFTKTSLPQMIEYRYDKGLAAGCIAAAGTLAMLIPPSLVMVVYAILTEQGIAQLLVAGLLPGLLLALLFSTYMYLRVRATPSLAPLTLEGVSLREKVRSLKGIWPIPALFALVMGGIYLGWFTPSAAAAIGAAGAVVLVFARREITRSELLEALKETGVTTSSIFMLVIGGLIFTRFVSLSGIIHTITAFVAGLDVPPLTILVLILLLYLFLGAFLESVTMMVVTLPVVFPLIVALGYDPIWFGVMVVLFAEIGLLTPPLGLNVYMVHSVADGAITMRQAFGGIFPFVFVSLVAAAILIAFPQIALFLPNSMY